MTRTTIKTSQHDEKENISPLRVKFVDTTELSTCPPTPRTFAAAKSILKQPTTTTQYLKEAERAKPSPVRMEDPLQCPTYFDAPLNTLIASLHGQVGTVSVHDVIEAYDLFTARVRDQSEKLKNTDVKYPAIEAMKKGTQNVPMLIMDALRRDIIVARKTPLEQTQPTSSNGVRRGMTEEEARRARDSSCVCHAALRMLTVLFAFPAMHTMFSNLILNALLDAVIYVASAEALPSLNPIKTYAYTISILGSQKLSKNILKRVGAKIANILRNAIYGKMGTKERHGPHYDGVRAIKVLLDEHPEIFLPHFTDMLPALYAYLISASLETRLLASKTVLAFAHAVSNVKISYTYLGDYSQEISDIIERDIHRSKKVETEPHTLKTHFKISRSSKTYEVDAAFSLMTTASFIILSGPLLFTRPKSLKYILKLIEEARKLRRSLVGQLLLSVWKCLIWSFPKIPKLDVSESHPGIEDQAYKILGQERDSDLSAALMGTLLSAPGDVETRRTNVVRAMETAKATIENFDNRTTGVHLVHSLITGDASRLPWKNKILVPEDLFWDRILDAKSNYIVDTSGLLPKIKPSSVPPLSEQEVEDYWDSLTALWKDAVNARLRAAVMQLESHSLEDWRTLLKSQARVASRLGSTNLSAATQSHIVNVYGFVFCLPQEGSPSVEEKQALKSAQQMWATTQEVFGKEALSDIAPKLLEHLISLEYKLPDRETEELWFSLCGALLFVNVQGALDVWLERTSRPQDEKLKQQVWMVFAKLVLDPPKIAVPLKDMIAALLFPMDWLRMHENHLLSWHRLLQLAISQAQRDSVPVSDITDPISDSLLQCSVSWNSTVPITILVLFVRRIIRLGFDEYKHWKVVVAASNCLKDCYPPEGPLTPGFIDFIRIYQQLVQSCHSEENLRALSKGLTPWVEDKSMALSNEHYNEQIISMYCDLLRNARLLTPIKLVFCDEDFLALILSVFTRDVIPSPAAGVVAFQNLWEDLSPALHFEENECPVRLAQCVKALVDSYGGNIPSWMQSESQTEHMMTSQPAGDSLWMPNSFSGQRSPLGVSISDVVVPETPLELQGMCPPPAVMMSTSTVPQVPTLPDSPSLSPLAYRQKRQKVYLSQSGQHESPAEQPPRPDARVLLDAVEVTPLHSEEKKKYVRLSASGSTNQHDTSSSPRVHVAKPGRPVSSDPDYSLWDTGLSSQAVHDLIKQDFPMEENEPEIHTTTSVEVEESQVMEEVPVIDTSHVLHATVEPRAGRSQTAPAVLEVASGATDNAFSSSIGANSAEMRANTLRRTRTTPLEALHQLHHAMSDDILEMETQDLAEAAQMVHEIQGLFQARISRKLESKRSSSPPNLFD